MIDHVTLQVTDVAASRRFYAPLLAPLGILDDVDFGEVIGFSAGDTTSFWLSPAQRPDDRELHLAFTATTPAAVDAFHAAAVALGAEVLHAPREFPEYHPGYYGCFVRDLDGHNIEAVCRSAPTAG